MDRFKTLEAMATDVAENVTRATETAISEQLNEFISRGLITLEFTQPILVRSEMSSKIEIRQQCRLLLKDQEYILKLEEENKALKLAATQLEAIVKQIGTNIEIITGRIKNG